MNTDSLAQIDVRHHLHPFTDYANMKKHGTRIITKAEGHYIFDSTGKRILDAMAGLWCVNVGYGREELVAAATEQMHRLPYYNSFFKTSNIPAARLAEKLATIAPSDCDHVFFANSGSEANDTIIRMARHFWALEGKPSKKIIISRTHGYHGSTLLAASMGGMAAMHAQAATLPDFHHIRPPYGFLYQGNMSEAEFAETSAGWLEDAINSHGADNIAGFIAEPIQGAGGVIIPPEGYFDHIQAICKKYDILFIADEVITGYGRTGEWFASQTMNLAPDLMATAKGLTSGYQPMSAVLVGGRVARRLIDDGGEFFHGFTYSGHPVAAAVALANLNLIESEGLIDKVRLETAPHLAQALTRLDDHPLVGETRSFGLLGAIELVADKNGNIPFPVEGKTATTARDHAIERGLMIRAVRDSLIISPPLSFTLDDIDTTVDIIALALDDTLSGGI